MLGSETKTPDILKGINSSLLRNINYKFLLFGNEKEIKDNLNKYSNLRQSIEIINCDEHVGMNDKPSDVIKKKVNLA